MHADEDERNATLDARLKLCYITSSALGISNTERDAAVGDIFQRFGPVCRRR